MFSARAARFAAATGVLLLTVACEARPPGATPPISPGTASAPREVNIIAKDWRFLPDPIDVVAGEIVLFHIVNGGLEIHEVVIGDQAVQDAWESAEAATVGHPPGPTPAVSVPAGLAGVRVVVASGQRVDLAWTVPAEPGGGVPTGTSAASAATRGLLVGCHIPGHWDKGMVVPIRFVGPQPGP